MKMTCECGAVYRITDPAKVAELAGQEFACRQCGKVKRMPPAADPEPQTPVARRRKRRMPIVKIFMLIATAIWVMATIASTIWRYWESLSAYNRLPRWQQESTAAPNVFLAFWLEFTAWTPIYFMAMTCLAVLWFATSELRENSGRD